MPRRDVEQAMYIYISTDIYNYYYTRLYSIMGFGTGILLYYKNGCM